MTWQIELLELVVVRDPQDERRVSLFCNLDHDEKLEFADQVLKQLGVSITDLAKKPLFIFSKPENPDICVGGCWTEKSARRSGRAEPLDATWKLKQKGTCEQLTQS